MTVLDILDRFLPSRGGASKALPDGVRVYAIGDIHGMLGPLRELEVMIAESARNAPGAQVIFLGDYIDRGPRVADVIDYLAERDFAGLPTRFLLGNHEDTLLQCMVQPQLLRAWLGAGGVATLSSYGVGLAPGVPNSERDQATVSTLVKAFPTQHMAFLRRLEASICLGDYVFVHAGLRPGRSLERQSLPDLLSIREPFLSYRGRSPYRVVHGHSISFLPEIHDNRIGVDTGAYATGRLSCAVLEGDQVEILTTGVPKWNVA